MKHVYPLYREKKNGKSKIDIDFQFGILNWKLNGRMTHGPLSPRLLGNSACKTSEISLNVLWLLSTSLLTTSLSRRLSIAAILFSFRNLLDMITKGTGHKTKTKQKAWSLFSLKNENWHRFSFFHFSMSGRKWKWNIDFHFSISKKNRN